MEPEGAPRRAMKPGRAPVSSDVSHATFATSYFTEVKLRSWVV
jgi:hypothetical protein